MTGYYLAIDQGGHASRAIVFDQQANIISQTEQPIQTFTPQPDRVEHDADEMIQATRQAIIDAVGLLGEEKKLLKAAGLATQRSSIACWNKQTGKPLSPILSWQDRRQAVWLSQFQHQSESIHAKTGLFLSPHYGASKMRWCLDNLAEVKQAFENHQLVIGPLASFLAYQLLTERPLVADPANASRTLLWNLHRQEWDELRARNVKRFADIWGDWLAPPRNTLEDEMEHMATMNARLVDEAGGRKEVPHAEPDQDQDV